MKNIASENRNLLGSKITIQIGEEHKNLLENCFEIAKKIETDYSRFLPDSKLSRINKQIGKWQAADSEMFELLVKANELYEITEGYFDITVKETLDRLGYNDKYSFEPEISKDNSQTFDRFLLDPVSSEVLLYKQIDFGGFGKGFAIDKIKEFLENNQVEHFLINAGGDIFAKKGEGRNPWKILLENPLDSKKFIGEIELNGQTIAASAANRRKWKNNLHHLINPKTNYPEQTNLAVFVFGKNGLETDAYSTGIFAAGFEKGIEISQKNNLKTMIISKELKIYKSKNFPS